MLFYSAWSGMGWRKVQFIGRCTIFHVDLNKIRSVQSTELQITTMMVEGGWRVEGRGTYYAFFLGNFLMSCIRETHPSKDREWIIDHTIQ